MQEASNYAQKLLIATKAMIAAVEQPQTKNSWGISVQSDNPNDSKQLPHVAWFESRQEAIDFLAERCVWVFPSTDPAEQAESAIVYGAVARRLADRLQDSSFELDELNALTRGLFKITWMGYSKRNR